MQIKLLPRQIAAKSGKIRNPGATRKGVASANFGDCKAEGSHTSKKLERTRAAEASTTLTLQKPSAPSTPQSDQPAGGELSRKPTTADQKLSRVQQAFATKDINLIVPLLVQAKLAAGLDADSTSGHKYILAAVHSLGARDGLEALLAVQMVSVHTLGMHCLANVAAKEQTDVGREVYINRANRLLRTFAAQVQALKSYRSRGEQHFTVEHVHVHSGGQAVVGAVNQNNRRETGSPGGGD